MAQPRQQQYQGHGEPQPGTSSSEVETRLQQISSECSPRTHRSVRERDHSDHRPLRLEELEHSDASLKQDHLT